ncbi:hypothetical protein ANCCAN_28574 [Ancylostoma caninum]|uniref:Uncharacterized protein n=1 Tax=Ancylostoma caninum TaxID=29170 RepID=A0A368F0V9_ANCCA|nr:hypothetical protein ANCCAN_28574 [Ancylostoma caninum]
MNRAPKEFIDSLLFVSAAIVCVTLLNRMKGDQVIIEHDQYIEFEERPFRLVTALIRKQLGY